MVLAATHIRALDYVTLAQLKEHAVDTEEAEAAATKQGRSAGECSSTEGEGSGGVAPS